MKRVLKWVGFGLAALAIWIGVAALAIAVQQSRVPVSLPTAGKMSSYSKDYVKVSGTWVIEGDKQAYPLQTTEISCERELKRCTSATGNVMGGDILNVFIDFYDIVSWEQSRVVFTDDNPNCVQYIYTIDFVSKSVNGVRQKRKAGPNLPEECAGLNQELRLSLKDGYKEYKQLQEQALPWFGHLALAPLKLFF